MTANDVIGMLAAHKTLGAAPREELAWLAEHGSWRVLQAGELLIDKRKPVEGMYIVFSGRAALFIDRGQGPTKAVEWGAGDVTGLLPYSRLLHPPGDSIVLETIEILDLSKDQLGRMTRECYGITSILVHVMLDRLRLFTSSDLHIEKMISLGKLSAGLAHELNNPASAIERSASLLEDRLEDSERAAWSLGAARLSDAQLAAVDAIRDACLVPQPREARSPLEQADREEAIAGWLAGRGLDANLAYMLSDTAVSLASLDQLAAEVPGPALNCVLRWVASGCAVRSMAAQIQDSAMRISSLTTAVKGFTHMGQAMVAEPVDLPISLSNTVAVLRSKAHEKSATVSLDLPPGLPPVMGFAAELNQIWGNLLDNALDAISSGGCVRVLASVAAQRVVVSVVDNGLGIPAGIQARIFDPFFTTKPQGQGIGLGLDIVRRLLQHNDGSIEFASEPGRTEFRVSLPVA